MRTAIYEVIRA